MSRLATLALCLGMLALSAHAREHQGQGAGGVSCARRRSHLEAPPGGAADATDGCSLLFPPARRAGTVCKTAVVQPNDSINNIAKRFNVQPGGRTGAGRSVGARPAALVCAPPTRTLTPLVPACCAAALEDQLLKCELTPDYVKGALLPVNLRICLPGWATACLNVGNSGNELEGQACMYYVVQARGGVQA